MLLASATPQGPRCFRPLCLLKMLPRLVLVIASRFHSLRISSDSTPVSMFDETKARAAFTPDVSTPARIFSAMSRPTSLHSHIQCRCARQPATKLASFSLKSGRIFIVRFMVIAPFSESATRTTNRHARCRAAACSRTQGRVRTESSECWRRKWRLTNRTRRLQAVPNVPSPLSPARSLRRRRKMEALDFSDLCQKEKRRPLVRGDAMCS